MKIVEIDAKGRLVIPEEVREESGISAPGQLLVTAEGVENMVLQSAEASKPNGDQARELAKFDFTGSAALHIGTKDLAAKFTSRLRDILDYRL